MRILFLKDSLELIIIVVKLPNYLRALEFKSISMLSSILELALKENTIHCEKLACTMKFVIFKLSIIYDIVFPPFMNILVNRFW